MSKKVLLCCLVLAAAAGVRRRSARLNCPAVLYTTFKQPAPLAVMHALEDEVESIMGPLGRHFVWRSISGVQGNEVSSELAVLTFKGRCDVAGIMPRETHPGALGWTHVSDGAILPFSEIDCDRIRDLHSKGTVVSYRRSNARRHSAAPWPAWWRTSCITSSPTRRTTARTGSERRLIPSRNSCPTSSSSRSAKAMRCAPACRKSRTAEAATTAARERELTGILGSPRRLRRNAAPSASL